jgi:hypothetical protein
MAEPLRLHPDDPTHLSWRGKAVFLLGSTEHYGAVLNGAFDYDRYLDTLAADRLSLTRAFTFYRELAEGVGDGGGSMAPLGYANTLTPRPAAYLAPWARSPDAHDVGADGLPKFDLQRWDERYFARLRAFLDAASARGIVVELVLFCNPYSEARWRLFPLHPASNVNGVGAGAGTWRDFMTLADPSLVAHQQRLVRKLVAETNAFDNVYYEICNEPAYSADGASRPALVRDWQRRLVDTVRETERALPKRHVVAVNPNQLLPVREPDSPAAEVQIALLDDGFYRRDPAIDLLNVHYLSHRQPREGLHVAYAGGARPRHPASYRFGNMTTFMALRATAAKAIGFDEDFAGIVSQQAGGGLGQVPRPAQARMEAWEALLTGCAAYDHLDLTFTTDDPTGAAGGSIPSGLQRMWLDGRMLRRRLSYVAEVGSDLDLAHTRLDALAVRQEPPGIGTLVARTGDDEQDLVVYLADTRLFDGGFGSTPVSGTVTLGGPGGAARYVGRALDPQTGAWSELPDILVDSSGDLCLEVLPFREDLLLRLSRVS